MIFLPLSLAAYASSLSLPALLFENREPLTGFSILAWGWWGFIAGSPAWGANPLYLFALYAQLTGKYKLALELSSVSLLLGSCSFFAKAWWFDEGSATPITKLGTGFYIWILSFFILLIGSMLSHNTNLKINR